SSSRWKRTLHESDLLNTSSGEWKMAHMKFREPSPGKPMIAILPKDSGKNVFSIAPYSEGDTVSVRYVAELTPEKLANGGNGTEVDSKAQSLWFAYLWYVAYLTLQTMGQADTSALALQHMQSYQAIPNGMPAPVPQA
ncbi:MAG: hypothetical protein NC048_10030, partial [Bacteroides sp.]|nr:hypothetical protein [Bacteroides sp.]